MNASVVMKAIADRIEGNVEGLAGVSYPALNTVPASPWVMIRQSRAIPTRYEKQGIKQIVHLNVEVIILVASLEDKPREESRIDDLIEPILDLFDATAAGGNINHAFTDLPEHIDRIWNEATVIRQAVKWGTTEFCYAAYITLDTQYPRLAVPLEVTP